MRAVLMGLFVCGFLFLLLTKSRTSAAGVIVALGAYWTVTTPLRTKLLLGLAGTWCVASLMLGVLLVGIDVEEQVAGAALMGREEQAESLTGRLPIWTTLAPFIAERPIAGYGFESFWTPDHIAEVSAELHWGIREAHSTFIDAILAVGLVGLFLAFMAVLVGMLRCQQRYAISRDPVHGMLLGMFAFGLINACTESAMLMHGYYTFMAGTGLWFMALRPALPLSQGSRVEGRGTVAPSPRDGGDHAVDANRREAVPRLADSPATPPEPSDSRPSRAPVAWQRGCSSQPGHTML